MSDNRLRILFIGMPDMGTVCLNELIKAGKNVVGVIPPPMDDVTYGMMKQQADFAKIPCLDHNNDFKNPKLLEKIKVLAPDIAIVASFNKKLPPELFKIPRLGTINCHPSLLPDYKGGNPYFHVINNGEKETGITYHFMDEDFDTGDIIAQVKVPVYHNDTMGILFNRLNYHSSKYYIELLNQIEKSDNIEGVPQDNSKNYKTAPKIYIEKGDNIINWNKDAQSIERFIRALNPFYGAMTYFSGIPVKIWAGKASNNINISNLEPGSIIKVTDKMVVISTDNGVYMPEILQFGTFMVSDVKDFILLSKIKAKDKFIGK